MKGYIMVPVEEKAMDVLDDLFQRTELPFNRIKSLTLHWEAIEGDFFPVLNCQFYEEKET